MCNCDSRFLVLFQPSRMTPLGKPRYVQDEAPRIQGLSHLFDPFLGNGLEDMAKLYFILYIIYFILYIIYFIFYIIYFIFYIIYFIFYIIYFLLYIIYCVLYIIYYILYDIYIYIYPFLLIHLFICLFVDPFVYMSLVINHGRCEIALH